MAYLTETDYKGLTDPHSLDVFQQFEPEVRQRAENDAQEEIAGYLRGSYNVEQVFAQTGNQRNPKITSLMVDIVLYNLATWLPGKMGLDIRIERYEKAIDLLDKAAKGKILLDLPRRENDNNPGTAAPGIRYGTGKQNKYDW